MIKFMRPIAALILAYGCLHTTAVSAANWRIATSSAQVSFLNGTPIASNSRFCVLDEAKSINVLLYNGAVSARLWEEATNQYFPALLSGSYNLPRAGCYVHSAREWYTGGNWYSSGPLSYVHYSERFADRKVSLPGLGHTRFQKVGDRLQEERSNIGDVHGRLLLDVYGLDDDLRVTINREQVLSVGFNKTNIYEFTQKLLTGHNTMTIEATDRNNGQCWGIAYRLGSADSWLYNTNVANSPCSNSLPKRKKVVYRHTVSFMLLR